MRKDPNEWKNVVADPQMTSNLNSSAWEANEARSKTQIEVTSRKIVFMVNPGKVFLTPFYRRSLMTLIAPLCPGAPLTAPPGCDPEPHRYKPFNGVRYLAASGCGRRLNI